MINKETNLTPSLASGCLRGHLPGTGPFSKSSLVSFWILTHRRNAWLSFLVERLNLSEKEENFLADIDMSYVIEVRALEKKWKKESFEMSDSFRSDMVSKYPARAKEIKRSFLTTEIDRLKKYPENEKKVKQLKNELYILNHPEASKDKITQSQIDRANMFDLGNVIEIKKGHVPCLWVEHERQPSMFYKNYFCHCFKCGKTASAITYVMKLKGLSFPDAVRLMQ